MLKNYSVKAALGFSALFAAVIGLVFFGKDCSDGALEGIFFCANELLPPLFPFMALSVFIAKRNVSFGKAGKWFSSALFGFSESLAPVILLSMIGGYPVGARGIKALRDSGAISEKEASLAANVLVGAGPGFLINFVGAELLGSRELGTALLVAQIISVILLGILNKIIFVKGNYNSDKETNRRSLPFSEALTEAVADASYGALEMCGMVVAFSAVLKILEKPFGVYSEVLLEVTNACDTLSKSGRVIPIAFAAGFGGLCVHFQIFTALRGIKLKKWLFFFFRIIQGLLTAALTLALIKAFGIAIPVFSSVGTPIELSLSAPLAGSAALMLCAVGFLRSVKP